MLTINCDKDTKLDPQALRMLSLNETLKTLSEQIEKDPRNFDLIYARKRVLEKIQDLTREM